MKESLQLSGVILAGGRGERLGGDKATIELGGELLLQRSVRLLAPLCEDIVVVHRPGQAVPATGARTTTDLEPYAGVLAGLAAGIQAARHEWSLVVACDMPFLCLPLLAYMAGLRPDNDIVVPQRPVGLEPLHALYHRRCLPNLMQALETGQRRVISFYEGLRVRFVSVEEVERFDPEGRSFFNVNTPQDLALARAWEAAQA